MEKLRMLLCRCPAPSPCTALSRIKSCWWSELGAPLEAVIQGRWSLWSSLTQPVRRLLSSQRKTFKMLYEMLKQALRASQCSHAHSVAGECTHESEMRCDRLFRVIWRRKNPDSRSVGAADCFRYESWIRIQPAVCLVPEVRTQRADQSLMLFTDGRADSRNVLLEKTKHFI